MKTLLVSIHTAILASIGFSQTLTLVPSNANGIYPLGTPVTWNVSFSDGTFTSGTYTIKKFGGTQIASGTIDLTQPIPQITAPALAEPGTLLAELKATPSGGSQLSALGGAIAERDKIRPSLARPADFDTFWASKLAALTAVPMNPVIAQADSGNTNVLYYQLEFDNYNGQKIYAQMARPVNGTSFPAMISMQYAGVYALPKPNVTQSAAQGWLAINVMAHPYPYDQPAEYYNSLGGDGGALESYPKIGNTSRDTSYFLGMFLGCIRSTDYLCSRPDWNGSTLLATGDSQGGFQAIALAALDPRVTAVITRIPAGAESAGIFAGRGHGWPYWTTTTAPNAALIKETSRYYDITNFAPRVNVPTLVGMGLIDTTCPPSGVHGMINELRGSKEVVFSPLEGHSGGTYAAYKLRRTAWIDALRFGNPAPVANLLAAPSVEANSVSESSILLQWSNNDAGSTAYVIEYSTTQGSGWQTLAEPAVGTTSYTHTGLVAGTPYYYRMRAVAPVTEVLPLATTMNPASDNTTVSATTQTSEPTVPEPRVFFRLRIEQTD
jgi:cephalosporin-C deacetylase